MATDVWSVLGDRMAGAIARVGEDFIIGFADLVVVILFLLIGYGVAKLLVYILHGFLQHINLEGWLKKRGLHEALLGFSLTRLLDNMLKLNVLAEFLANAADVAKIVFLRDLVTWFVHYIPLLVQGVVVVVLALLGGEYITNHIKKSSIPFARFVALALEVFIAYTGIVIALPLILPNADVSILADTFKLIVLMFVLALGLGFAIAIGLGAKDTVGELVKSKKDEFKKLF